MSMIGIKFTFYVGVTPVNRPCRDRDVHIPPSTEGREILDKHFASPQYPECVTSFMADKTPQVYFARLTMGQIKVAEKGRSVLFLFCKQVLF